MVISGKTTYVITMGVKAAGPRKVFAYNWVVSLSPILLVSQSVTLPVFMGKETDTNY